MPRIPAIGSVGRKIVEFEASLNFIRRPFLLKKIMNGWINKRLLSVLEKLLVLKNKCSHKLKDTEKE